MRAWVFGSLRGYRRTRLPGDVIARLTVWAVLVPEALAYATIAGVSPRRMLLQLHADLARDSSELVIARDVLQTADAGTPAIRTYASVREAVDAVGHPPGVMRHHPAPT